MKIMEILSLLVVLIVIMISLGCVNTPDNSVDSSIDVQIEDSTDTLIDDSTDTLIDDSTDDSSGTMIGSEPETITDSTSENKISEDLTDLNSDNIIYSPLPGTSWQWQLSGTINTKYNVEMYDVDLVETPQSIIDQLHQEGRKVICYFSAGSWEEFRDDANDFPKSILGNTLEGWPDEKWLDVSNYNLFANVMEERLDLAVEKGCDGVEPDNVDGYLNENGFDLNYQDQLEYNQWLTTEAHKRGLSIGLKNDLDQIDDLVDYFDFAVNEQCFEYDECEMLVPFIEHGKAVFGVEYELEPENFCEEANQMDFSWLKMEYDLDGGRIGCS
ncbi:MAG: endo alpha-1,4 polygalactosaminidase [Candidatus Woesearchaeota archaeon]